MTPNKAFNNKIQSYLTNQPNSDSSKTIRLIKAYMNRKIGFYVMFDEFAYKLGIGISATGFLDNRDRLSGYIPYIIY